MSRILIFIFLISCFSITAQVIPSNYCGTSAFKDPWLTKYQKNPQQYTTRFDDTIYVPLTVHIVGDDEGNKRMTDLAVIKALNILQNDYKESKIHFFLTDVFQHHFFTKWSEHEEVVDGADMMFELNHPNSINCYILLDGAGNCGYNLPYAGMVVSNNCANTNDHTWAHEMGHGLSLPHPFLGWEGGVSWDGSVTHNFSQPAPDSITFNYTYFKDTLIRDTIIIDTIQVEKMDRSNCHLAADGFCDTAPDYLASRWPCSTTNHLSATIQTDPNGEKFQSDGTLIMSYADDACASRFSQEQMEAMRANLIDDKPHLLYNQIPKVAIEQFELELQNPSYEEIIHYQNIELEWSALDSADFYLVQISTFPGMQIVQLDTMVSNNTLQIDELKKSDEYYWRVMPINSHNFDIQFSDISKFITSELVSTSDISEEIKCYPTILGENSNMDITIASPSMIDEILVTNIENQMTFHNKGVSSKSLTINTDNWSRGVHFIRIVSGDKVGIKKVIIL